jgi:hypothetical protein
VTVLRGKWLLSEVCEKAHERLINYAAALEQQGDAGRAKAWRMFSENFTKTQREH